MKSKKAIAALALSACLALGIAGMTACDTNGKSAYDLWLEQGNTGTVQEFLDSLKGEKGDKGDTGDQGLPGEGGQNGQNGETPQIEINEDGNWVINGEDTGVKAAGTNGQNGTNGTNGTNGQNGQNGKDGNTWIVKDGEPTSSDGKDGDLCLDKSEWNVWQKVDGEWQLLGCIASAAAEEKEPLTASVTLQKSTPAELDITELDVGLHLIYIDIGAQKMSEASSKIGKFDGGRIQVKVGDTGKTCELTECDERTEEGVKNVFYGFLIKEEGDTTAKISLLNDNKTYMGAVSIEDYKTPTLKADGTKIIVPINLNNAENRNDYKFNLDSSIEQDKVYTLSLESNSSRARGTVYVYMFGAMMKQLSAGRMVVSFQTDIPQSPATYGTWKDATLQLDGTTNVVKEDDRTGCLYFAGKQHNNAEDNIFIGLLSMVEA